MDVIDLVDPAGTVVNVHGNAVEQLPEFDTSVTPTGTELDTLTDAASDAPAFVIVSV